MTTVLPVAVPAAVPATRRARGRRTVLTAVVGLLAGLVLVLSSAAPSSAIAVTGAAGARGTVWRNGAMVTAYDVTAYQALVFTTDGVTVASTTTTAHDQGIYVQYQLQQSGSGGWSPVATTGTMSGSAAGSGRGSVRFGTWQYTLPRTPSFAYGYRIVAIIAWYDLTTGRNLGYEVVYPNLAGESVCHTTTRRCTAYTDGLTV